MDAKGLDDIPELWPQIQRRRLPTIQYTAREVTHEVTSGLHFLAYSYERGRLALSFSFTFGACAGPTT